MTGPGPANSKATFGSGTTGSGYLQQTFTTKGSVTTASPPLAMDSYGRLEPDPNRFPGGIVDGVDYTNGMAYLGAYIHSLGLDFGIHIMRGIPQQAVFANDPVYGTNGTVSADQIAAGNGTGAPWLNQMQGLDVGSNGQLTTGAQDYYNSIFDQYASWGVDYVKVDDMLSTTYHSADVAGVAEAIAQSGRPMVYSLSPGPAPLSEAPQLTADANMWRMLNDMWDNWGDVSAAFAAGASWESYIGNGHWPDADMLPLGSFLNPPVGTARTSQLTDDQQRTVMTFWSIMRSPLIMGGDLPSLASDPWTTSLLTNSNILAVDQSSTNNHQVSNSNNQIVWAANAANSTGTYAALFNTGSSSTSISTTFGALGLTAGATYDVWDEWKNIDLGNWNGGFSATIASDGAGMFKILPAEASPPPPQWYNDASGDWNVAGNWASSTIPNAAGAEADFFVATTSSHTVFTDIPITVGTLNFNNTHTFEISGTGSLTLQGTTASAQVIVQSGIQEINLPTTIASNTIFNVATVATLIIAAPLTIDSGNSITQTGGGMVTYQSIVNVQSGAAIAFASSATMNSLQISPNSSGSIEANGTTVLEVSNLSINGTLDLNDNTLEVDYGAGPSPINEIRDEIRDGYNGGYWNGTGLTSSLAAASGGKYALAYVDGSIDSGTPAQPGEVLVKYALVGDARLEGTVGFDDLLIVADHYGTSGNDWSQGNFTYDPAGMVGFADLLALAQNYQQPLTDSESSQLSPYFLSQWALAESEVPEPATNALAVGATFCLLVRRRQITQLRCDLSTPLF